jgi:heat-inducible transcriptional repressor
MRLAAAILAQSMRNASLVTAPRSSQVRFKHLELISIQESLALLVAVFDGGTVQQQMFVPVEAVTQEELSTAAARLNRIIEGRNAQEFEAGAILPPLGEIEAQALDLVRRMARALAEQTTTEVVVDGLSEVLGQPEFSGALRVGVDPGSARQVVQLMQQGLLFNDLIRQLAEIDGLQVIIGGNGTWQEMRPVSLVVSRYGNTTLGGLLGVLGPTRMHYGRAVAVVRFVSSILGEMAAELGGRGETGRWGV